MSTELENDFEYLLLHSPPGDPTLPENLARAYYGYAHTLINLLFEAPENLDAVLTEVFTDSVRHLDKYLLGTNFKLWFTRRAIKVARKRLKTRKFYPAHWPVGKESSDQPAEISPQPLPIGSPSKVRAPAFSRLLPFTLAGPMGLSLAELAEYFKTSENTILKRVDQAVRTFIDQIKPGWTALPTGPGRPRDHRAARQAVLIARPGDAGIHSMDSGHLPNCPQCSAFASTYKDLSTHLRSWAVRGRRSKSPAIDNFIEAMRSDPNVNERPARRRLPYMEVFWVMLAAGLVLTIGWVFNQVNPLTEVQSAIQSLETPVPQAILDNPPERVVNTGQVSNEKAVQIEPESSWDPQISSTGRQIVFASSIRRLVDGDTNEVNDIFVYNFENKLITRVSVDSAGQQANNASYEPGISANGRYIVFTSWANNLVPDDKLRCDNYGTVSSCPDIFLHDLVTGETRLISKNPEGKPGNNLSQSPQISADGGTIAFWSAASDLVPDDQAECTTDNNIFNCLDIFIYSPPTDRLARIPIGRQINQIVGNFELSLSADGRFILFTLESSDLLAQELGISRGYEVYLYDRETGSYEPVNVAADGTPGDDSSYSASMSDDGRWVAFSSRASNLVPNDTRGSIDVFLRDRQDGTIQRISSAFDGGEADENSGLMGDPDLEWWYGESLRISGDGNWIIFASKARSLTRQQQDFYCGFSPDCTNNLYLFDRLSGQTLQINVSNIDFIPFASLSQDGQFAAFMAHSANCNPSDFCTDIYIFSRESGIVAQLGSYGILTGKEIPITTPPLENQRTLHLHQYWTTSVAFSPAGDILAAGARDGTVSLWSLPLEQRLDSLEGQIIAFSPDGALLAAGGDDGQVYLWAMPQRRLAGVLNNKQRARGLAFSPDGRFLAVGSSLRVRLWNLETGTVDQEFSYPGTVILDVAISPDGAFVAAAADDKTIWITSLNQPGYALRLGGHEDKVNTVEFSPDGLLLASGGNDNRVNLWVIEEDPNGLITAVRQTTFLHEDWVTSVAFSPDSRLLATGSFDNSVAVWDVQNGELLDLPFQQNQNQVLSVTWSPDGTSLAAGTVRGEVHVWEDLVFDK